MKHLWLMVVGNGENNVSLETKMNWLMAAIWLTNIWGIELHMISHWFSFSPLGLFVIMRVFYLFLDYIRV